MFTRSATGLNRSWSRLGKVSAVGRWQPHGDDSLVVTALVLTALGLVMVYSASLFVAAKQFRADWFIFLRQVRMVVVGLGALLVGMFVPPEVYRRWVGPALAALCVVMVLQLFTPLGPVISHTRRWVSLGVFNLQTSEIARCLQVIYLAKVFTAEPHLALRPNRKLWVTLGVAAVPATLTLLQPDLSGALVMGAAALTVIFLSGLGWKTALLMGSATLPPLVVYVLHKPYQIKRLTTFLSGVFTGGDLGYQTLQSLIGFGRGGLLGVGLGQGKQKMLFLPEPHTDFIFAIIGEELGLVGAAAVLAAFLLLCFRMFKVCRAQADRFRYLLGSGLSWSLALLALIHMGVAVGLMPVTGLPLPFISSGGTNLVVSLWSVGVMWNLSRECGISGLGAGKRSVEPAVVGRAAYWTLPPGLGKRGGSRWRRS